MRPVWLILAGALAVVGCSPEVPKRGEEPAKDRDVRRFVDDPTAGWGTGLAHKEAAHSAVKPGSGVEPPPTPEPTAEPTPEPEPEPEPESDPGPGPTADCALEIDEDGFFERELADGTHYVGFLPPGYSGEPTRLFVGLHGCGDDAENFAEWAVNPPATRGEQRHIGISVEDDDGGGGCWSAAEIPRVLRAIEDVSRCVYVHQKKIVLGGFSSGGVLAYELGLSHAALFSGILVQNASLRRASDDDELIENASWRLPIAHIAHTDDDSFPIDDVREDWERLRDAGFPLETAEVDGDHDGTTEDWAEWLLPNMDDWESP